MKILVTGGAGFVGSVFVPLLLRKGYKVRVYDNLLYGVEGLLGCFLDSNFEFFKGDVRDKSELAKAIKGCDAVVHLAALVGYPICKKNEDDAMAVNITGTQTLASVVPKDVPLIFASTGSCYGNLEEVCKEELPLKPLTIYGETKALAEIAVQQGGNFVTYRFATGYGVSPRLRLDLLINDFCYKAVYEKNLIVYERHFQRTFVHVYDMARAFLFGIQHFEDMKNETYNVGSEGMNLSKQFIAEFIKVKVPYYLHYADVGHDEDKRDYAVSYEKMNKTGFKTGVTLDQGVDQLINLFKAFEITSQYSNV